MSHSVTSLSKARHSLTELAYESLEEAIVTLKLKPGSTHSESDLQQLIGIGRTPVREALQQLSREGLVEILPRKGLKITKVAYEDQFQRVELNRTLLSLMARTAAVRATSEQRKSFSDIAVAYDNIARNPDLDSIMQLDKTMFDLLCDACHNEFVDRAIRHLAAENRRLRYIHFQKHADIPIFARIRAQLSRALQQGDAVAAETSMNQRMDYIESTLKARTLSNGN